MPARRHSPVLPQRVGSAQVLSVRGRRVVVDKPRPAMVFFAVAVIVLCALGIGGALALSATTTAQSFKIATLRSQTQVLDNQLEALNRDVASAKSSAEIARRAADLGLVAPHSPGVLAVSDEGHVEVLKHPAPDHVGKVIDVNGSRVRPFRASSDPMDTDHLSNSLEAIPQALQPAAADIPAVAPYAPNVRTHTAGGAGE